MPQLCYKIQMNFIFSLHLKQQVLSANFSIGQFKLEL